VVKTHRGEEVMPFTVPKVLGYQEPPNAITLVVSSADPTNNQLAEYIHWLEQELIIARAAYKERAGVEFDPTA
jgi:hypothetical protein